MSKPIPPAPPGWNKTIADLFAEAERGERLVVGSPEVDWARDFERRQIPADMRFPRKGDRVVVDTEPVDSRAISTYASAVDYGAMEERIVPASERSAPKYSGFYFSFKTVDLNRKFRLVHQEQS